MQPRLASERTQDPGVSQQQIVATALDLLREGGLNAVSMRKIGTRLGVKAPSLYWHVENKGTLHQLMSQAIFEACLESMPACRDWRQWLREFGLALWRAQSTTPDIRTLIFTAPVDRKSSERVTAQIVETLAALGLAPHIGRVAQQSVQALVTGWTTLRRRPVSGSGEDAFRDSLEVLITGWENRARA